MCIYTVCVVRVFMCLFTDPDRLLQVHHELLPLYEHLYFDTNADAGL